MKSIKKSLKAMAAIAGLVGVMSLLAIPAALDTYVGLQDRFRTEDRIVSIYDNRTEISATAGVIGPCGSRIVDLGNDGVVDYRESQLAILRPGFGSSIYRSNATEADQAEYDAIMGERK